MGFMDFRFQAKIYNFFLRWTVEFFGAFFGKLGLEILEVVEESILKKKVSGALKATFVALIPKKDKIDLWNHFHPISLCNLLYKIIMKVIFNQIKPFLSRWMTKAQFKFLDGK